LITQLLKPELPPLTAETWGATALVLPEDAPERWLNIFTGEELRVFSSEGKRLLRLASVFQTFPLALLTTPNSENPAG
jgi:maltooligosyltrehalose synthase